MKTEGSGILKLDNGHGIPIFWSCLNFQQTFSGSYYTVYVDISNIGFHRRGIQNALKSGGFGENPLTWEPHDIAVIRFRALTKFFKIASHKVEGFHTSESDFKGNVIITSDTLEGDLL